MAPRTKWTLCIAAPLFVALLLAVFWFSWGACLRERFEDELRRLEASGEPLSWEALAADGVPDDENGAGLLVAADAMRRVVEDELLEEGVGVDGESSLPSWDEDEPWTDEERAVAAEGVRRLAPYYAALDQVLARPRLAFAPAPPGASGGSDALVHAVRLLEMRACLHPATFEEDLDRILGLLARWEPSSGLDQHLLFGLLRRAVRLVREALVLPEAEGRPLLARYTGAFEAVDAGAVTGLRRALRDQRVAGLWMIHGWAEGRNPLARHGATVHGATELLEHASESGSSGDRPSGDGAAPEDADVLGAVEAIDATVEAVQDLPFQGHWYGRPLLWRDALVVLEDVAAEIQASRSLAGVRALLEARRTAPPRPFHGGLGLQAVTLRLAAQARMTRIALAARDHALEHGSPPRDPGALAARLGGRVPQDPLTGRPFVYRAEGPSAITIGTDPAGALLPAVLRSYVGLVGSEREARLEEDGLRWRVRW